MIDPQTNASLSTYWKTNDGFQADHKTWSTRNHIIQWLALTRHLSLIIEIKAGRNRHKTTRSTLPVKKKWVGEQSRQAWCSQVSDPRAWDHHQLLEWCGKHWSRDWPIVRSDEFERQGLKLVVLFEKIVELLLKHCWDLWYEHASARIIL